MGLVEGGTEEKKTLRSKMQVNQDYYGLCVKNGDLSYQNKCFQDKIEKNLADIKMNHAQMALLDAEMLALEKVLKGEEPKTPEVVLDGVS